MALSTRQQLVTNANRVYAGTNGRKYITIHETANTNRGANAAAHANLQSRGNVRNASWHWQVDDKEAVQSYAHTARCWHAGDGRGPGNLDSIAIEICVNSDGDYAKAVANAQELAALIAKQENIPVANIVQHNRWSTWGKNCPAQLRNTGGWAAFLAGVASLVAGSTPTPKPTPKPKPAKGYNLAVDGWPGPLTVRALQVEQGTVADAKISGQAPSDRRSHPRATNAWQFVSGGRGSNLVASIQAKVGAKVDRYWGANTSKRVQAYLGRKQTGIMSKADWQEIQRRLNRGTW